MNDSPVHTDAEKFALIGRLCLCANLRQASRIITSLYDEFLQAGGLQVTQFILLTAVASQTAIAVTPLAHALGMDATTLARNLRLLERDGLLQVTPGTDRRTRIVRLTESGSSVLSNCVPLWEQAHAFVTGQLGAERAQQMLGDLADLSALIRR